MHLATLTYQVPVDLVEAVGRAVNEVISSSPDLSVVQATADRDAGHMPTCALAPRDDLTVGTHTSPATSQGADGHPLPSSDALPAGPLKGEAYGKSGRAVPYSPERDAGSPDSAICNTRVPSGDSRPAARGPLENAAKSPAGDPVRTRPSLRPHCQNRSLCASGTRDHCHSCKKAMAESEAA